MNYLAPCLQLLMTITRQPLKLWKPTNRVFPIFLILGILLPAPTQRISAAPAAVVASQTQQQQQATSASGDGDRSNNSGAAAAAAAAGAAMAGLGCIMGLRAAQQAPPDQKAMLQMMAMQQCAQAAQNAASAAQNNDQKKKLDAPPTTQSAPFQTPEFKEPEDGEKPDFSALTKNETSPASASKEPTNNYKPLEIPDAPTTKTVEVPDTKAPVGPVLPKTSTPQLMDQGTITAKKEDDNSNNGNEVTKVLGNALAGRGSADDLLKKALAEAGTNPNDAPIITPKGAKSRGAGGEAEGENGGNGFSNGEGKGNDPFESLLAQMMGGGQVGGLETGFGGGMDIAYLPTNKKGIPKLNIFQFASTVYSELAHTANRVTIRPHTKANPSERALSTVTNSVIKASIR